MCRISMGHCVGEACGLLATRMLFLLAGGVRGALETARGTCLVFLAT